MTKRYVMRLNGTGNEIGHAMASNPITAAEIIWERYQDGRARDNPELAELLNREVPYALVSVYLE